MIKIPLLLLLIGLSQSLPQAPSPHCRSLPFTKNLPLVFQQTMTIDLANYFTGYNLQIVVSAGQDIGYLPPKMNRQSQDKVNFTGIISYDLRHKDDNSWGDDFLLLRQINNQTVLYYGSFAMKRAYPSLVNVTVQRSQSIFCYDAVVNVDLDLAIIDCSEYVSQKYSNLFFYVRLSTGEITKKVPNQIYIDFKSISKRKLIRYTDKRTGFEYLVRAYLSDGVDFENSGNTYFELISAADWQDLQIISVMDRSQLGLTQLAIMDVHLYLGDLYVLDYHFGLYRFDIHKSQSIIPIGIYRCEHFTKLSIYSDDLENEFILAIANEHSVHEINWNDIYNPYYITKYSLLEKTQVSQVQINKNYVVVQGAVKVLSQFVGETQLYYTWIFTRGSRVYTDVYAVIYHQTKNVFIELEKNANYILTIDEQGFKNYQLRKSILTLNTNSKETNQSVILEIMAQSMDFIDPNVDVCFEKTIIHLVDNTSLRLWETGITTSEDLYANYPGELIIPLERYALGSNIKYQFQKSFARDYQPQHYINKQNQTVITRQGPGPAGKINYLHTDVLEKYGNNTILAYYQDTLNNTYVSMCQNEWFTSKVKCVVQSHYQHKSAISNLTTAIVDGPFGPVYIFIFTLTQSTNNIMMYYFDSDNQYAVIKYPEGIAGFVGDLSVSNGLLFVTLPFVKRIDVYSLKQCITGCVVAFSITANLMKNFRIEYFSPKQVVTTSTHPEVIFIVCVDSIVILDVDNKNNIQVLSQLNSIATASLNFKVAINQQYLVIVSPPRLIEQYKLVDIYRGQVVFHKSLPLYNYIIPFRFDLEFNDFGNLFYLTAQDNSNLNAVVLVYKMGRPLVTSLYDVIQADKFAHDDVQLEVSGGFVDFVSIVASGVLYIYKQFQTPTMVVKDVDQSFEFYIHLQTSQSEQNLSLVKVNIANYPDNFNKSSGFPSNLRFIKDKIDTKFSWSDRNWFRGHILNNYYRCEDCPDKIVFEGHITQINELQLLAQDYIRSFSGGYILWDDILRLHHNGTVHSVETLPKSKQNIKEKCQKIVSNFNDLFVISACSNTGNQVNLYMTSYTGRKGFTLGPYKTNANWITNVQIVNQILMLVDVNPDPSLMYRTGGVFLYTLSLDRVVNDRFNQIECIDTNDLKAAHGWNPQQELFIGNAHLILSNQTQQYRLFITEVKNGLFIVSFSWNNGNSEISLKSVDFVDLNSVIIKNNFHMPSDATFEAVTHLAVKSNIHFQIETVLVTTNNYHSFEFFVVYSDTGRLLSCTLNKVYYRYGYYNTYNYVKAFNGYVAIAYTIPPIQQILSNFSRQVIALYDASDYESDSAKGYAQRYIITGNTLSSVIPTTFDFNISMDRNTAEQTTGLVIIDPTNKIVSENKVSKNLTVIVKDPNFMTQNLFIWPYSDFHKSLYELKLIGLPDTSLKAWQIVLIVIGSLLAAVGLGIGGKWAFGKWKIMKKKTYLLQQQEQIQQQQQPQTQNTQYERVQINQSVEIKEGDNQNKKQQDTRVDNTQEPQQKQNQEEQQNKESEVGGAVEVESQAQEEQHQQQELQETEQSKN